MAIECTPGSLVDLAACFAGLSPTQHQAISTYLLCQIANAGGGAAQTPWTSDIDGDCFNLNNVCMFNGIGVYRALVSQAGTAAPTATVLENTLGGTPVWTRASIGTYSLTLAGAFPATRTFLNHSESLLDVEATAGNDCITFNRISDDVVQYITSSGGVLVDFEELGISTVFIEILVYPATPQCPDCAS